MGKSKDRQQQVILNYKANGGNMKKAMIDAGYSETYADRNSKYLLGIIGEQIREQQDEIKSQKVKSIAEIQEWWSEIMDSSDERRENQIKCSELLAKSQGGFLDKVQINGNVNNPMAGLTTEELKKLIADD
jgi:phage terminase small subunit